MKRYSMIFFLLCLLCGCSHTITKQEMREVKEVIDYEIKEYDLKSILPELEENEEYYIVNVYQNHVLIGKNEERVVDTNISYFHTTGLYSFDLVDRSVTEITDIEYNQENEAVIDFYPLENGLYLYMIRTCDEKTSQHDIYLDLGDHSNCINTSIHRQFVAYPDFIPMGDVIYFETRELDLEAKEVRDPKVYRVDKNGKIDVIYEAPINATVNGFAIGEGSELLMYVKLNGKETFYSYDQEKWVPIPFDSSYRSVFLIQDQPAFVFQDEKGLESYQLLHQDIQYQLPQDPYFTDYLKDCVFLGSNPFNYFVFLQDNEFVYQKLENQDLDVVFGKKIDEDSLLLVGYLYEKIYVLDLVEK